ncbi:hypothetical protein OROMI_017756 [Orobanche minor]
MATAALLCCRNTIKKSQYASLFVGKKRAVRSKGVKGITIKKPLLVSSSHSLDDDEDEDEEDKSMTVEKKRKLLDCWDYADDASKVPVSVCIKEPRLVSGCVSIYDYECLDRIGHGTYGTVFRALHTKTGQIVAVKKELHGLSKSSLMEIDILRSLDHHPSIVGYKQVAVDDHDGVYAVMEYVEYDLQKYLKRPRLLTLPEVKRLMKELLEGVKFLHENRVMHRDLKPSNVLISTEGNLKICDFGMSRQFPSMPDSTCTAIVGTLWYRAPELLLGEHTYSSAVDMWSVGCIMAEFFLGQVLFKGKSEIHQLRVIHNVASLQFQQPSRDYDLLYDKLIAATASRGGPMLTEAGFDLLCRLLAFHPENRITAEDALNHDWFGESSP